VEHSLAHSLVPLQPLALLLTALTLGLRHGIDWDHIAALIDISGSASGRKNANWRGEALTLSLLYALGHACIVVLLGIAAISFAAVLPQWVDGIMERIVGVTLFALGCYLLFVVAAAGRKKDQFQLQSRWMFVFSLLRGFYDRLFASKKVAGEKDDLVARGRINGWTAFAIGVLHGIGAETGSQVLLIAAAANSVAAAGQGFSLSMLGAFVVGLLTSNTLVALVSTSGFRSSTRLRPLYLLAGVTAGAFSLCLGLAFILGQSDSVPNPQDLKFFSSR